MHGSMEQAITSRGVEKVKIATLANILIEVRMHNNLTQRQLARLLGHNLNCIWRWENGINKPRVTTRYAIEKRIAELKEQGIIV